MKPFHARAIALRCTVAVVLYFLAGIAASAASPPFDIEKWRNLSVESKGQFDVIFFNEMVRWSHASRRYNGDPNARRQDFQRMAVQGYLPAYAALTLASNKPDRERFDLLRREAGRGDLSAICSLVTMPLHDSLWPDSERIPAVIAMMKEGADRGHPACLGAYGRELLIGSLRERTSVPPDPARGRALLLETARQGYHMGIYSLFSYRFLSASLRRIDWSDSGEVDRALCWGRLVHEYTTIQTFQDFLRLLRTAAQERDQPDLLVRAARFDPKRGNENVSVEQCVRLEQTM